MDGSNSHEDEVSYTPSHFVLNPYAFIMMEGGLPHQPPPRFNDWCLGILTRYMLKI